MEKAPRLSGWHVVFGLSCGLVAYHAIVLAVAAPSIVTNNDANWVLLFIGDNRAFLLTALTPVLFVISFRAIRREGGTGGRHATALVAGVLCVITLMFGTELTVIVVPYLGLFV